MVAWFTLREDVWEGNMSFSFNLPSTLSLFFQDAYMFGFYLSKAEELHFWELHFFRNINNRAEEDLILLLSFFTQYHSSSSLNKMFGLWIIKFVVLQVILLSVFSLMFVSLSHNPDSFGKRWLPLDFVWFMVIRDLTVMTYKNCNKACLWIGPWCVRLMMKNVPIYITMSNSVAALDWG